jgi:hypothetical protein
MQAALTAGKPVNLPALNEAFEHFVDQAGKWLANATRGMQDAAPHGVDADFEAFLALLRAQDIRAIAQFKKMKAKFSDRIAADTMEAIQIALNKFDFETAYELLQVFGADTNS